MTSPSGRSLAQRTDQELMVTYLSGDNSAFQEIVRRHGPALHRFIVRGLHHPDEAEDLVQQAFLLVHRARYNFDTREPLRPWLFTIGLNVKREYLRNMRRLNEVKILAGYERQVVAGLEAKNQFEAEHDVDYALSRLSPANRDVLELHWLADLSFDEVAKVLGDSTSAVKVRAHRSFVKLREAFSEKRSAFPVSREAKR